MKRLREISNVILIMATISFLVIAGLFLFQFKSAIFYRAQNRMQSLSLPVIEEKNEKAKPSLSEKPTKYDNLPASVRTITMPFMSQAPTENWDAFHEDACEEASLLMVKHFVEKSRIGSKESFDQEINSMIKYEEEHGYLPSITLDQLNKIAADYLGMTNGKVIKNVTVDDIKNELFSGKPVIIGAAGRLLENPHFKNGGPNYHMLVIKGYNSKGFITNDPGTKYGETYFYDFHTLYEAIHDYDKKDILNGGRDYLVF